METAPLSTATDRPEAVYSADSSRGAAAVPSPAIQPIKVMMAQGFISTLACPTPDQASSAEPSSSRSNRPAAVEKPLTD